MYLFNSLFGHYIFILHLSQNNFLSTAEMRIVVKPAHVVMKYLLFLYFKSESKSVNVWRKEMLQSVYPLYTFPDNIYFVYVPGKNTFEPKINYLLKVFLSLTEKFLRIFPPQFDYMCQCRLHPSQQNVHSTVFLCCEILETLV